jgi:hypothetical protein
MELLHLLATGHVEELIADVYTDTASWSTATEGTLDERAAFHGHASLGVQRIEQLIAPNKRIYERTAKVCKRSIQYFG